jgi:hypothetical protein
MGNLIHLLVFDIKSGGYSSLGTSAILAIGGFPVMDDRDLEALNAADLAALGDLQRRSM